MGNSAESVIQVIDYIEDHLSESLDLERVSRAVHYSKYHLHRIFVNEVGLTIHDYVQRRKLTEAAKLLVFSEKTIMEIAFIAGYESRQAFSVSFKEMYKKTPNQYREEEEFYPLQLRYRLNKKPARLEKTKYWQQRIVFAGQEDIGQWMELVRLVVDGFPYLNEEDYLVELMEYIRQKRALILKDGDTAVGILAFYEGRIDFLGVHPQYRRQGIAEALLRKALDEFADKDMDISVTTFREGDKADTGYRDTFKRLGFAEAELLTEFGYPTQRFVLKREGREGEMG